MKLLPGAHAAQEPGNCEVRTGQRYLVALTLARVQSDKRSAELEEPVLEWKWIVLSVPQFHLFSSPK